MKIFSEMFPLLVDKTYLIQVSSNCSNKIESRLKFPAELTRVFYICLMKRFFCYRLSLKFQCATFAQRWFLLKCFSIFIYLLRKWTWRWIEIGSIQKTVVEFERPLTTFIFDFLNLKTNILHVLRFIWKRERSLTV